MRIDDLPGLFKESLDRCEAVLSWEVAAAKKARDALSAERAKMQAEVSKLQDERVAVQKQLDDVLSNLERGSALAGLEHDIKESRKTLAGLTSQTEKASADLAKLEKECQAAEPERDAIKSEMQRLMQQGSEATAELGRIRTLFQSFETRRSA
jgi:chromosome segregation ATPase